MGAAVHNLTNASQGTRCRIYAQVGAHRDLLAYLVRRLLENGANSSFVNQIIDPDSAHVLFEQHVCIDTTAAGRNAALLHGDS